MSVERLLLLRTLCGEEGCSISLRAWRTACLSVEWLFENGTKSRVCCFRRMVVAGAPLCGRAPETPDVTGQELRVAHCS